MWKAIIAVSVLIIGLTISMVFQNCGGSSLEANDSNNPVLTVDNPLEDNRQNENSGDGTDGDGDGDGDDDGGFNFNLNNGDNVFYLNGGGQSLDTASSRILARLDYTMLESHIYEQQGASFDPDIPMSYCQGSALPHCEYRFNEPCRGLGCLETNTPVRCHWQKRLSENDINTVFPMLNELEFLQRVLNPDEMVTPDCNTPILTFFGQETSLELSMAERACVPDGQFFISNDTGDNLATFFNGELDSILSLTDNQGGAEFCNNFSAYVWTSTNVLYISRSGNVPANDEFSFRVNFVPRNIMIDNEQQLAGMVDMVFQEAGNDRRFFCANNVPVQPDEILGVFFPENGVQYEFFRPSVFFPNLPQPHRHITYTDPADNGRDWQFYLDRDSAITERGGAVLLGSQSQALVNLVENVLVQRARDAGLAEVCTPNQN
jgi:hypothetical protein